MKMRHPGNFGSEKRILVVGSGPGTKKKLQDIEISNYDVVWALNDAGRNLRPGSKHNIIVVDPVFLSELRAENLVQERFDRYLDEYKDDILRIAYPRRLKFRRSTPKFVQHFRTNPYNLIPLPTQFPMDIILPLLKKVIIAKVVNILPICLLHLINKDCSNAEVDLIGVPYSWHETLRKEKNFVCWGVANNEGRDRAELNLEDISFYFTYWAIAFRQIKIISRIYKNQKIGLNFLDSDGYLG